MVEGAQLNMTCREQDDFRDAKKGDVWIEGNDVFIKLSNMYDGGLPRWSGQWTRLINHFTRVEDMPQNVQLSGDLVHTKQQVEMLNQQIQSLLGVVVQMEDEVHKLRERVYGKPKVQPGHRLIDMSLDQAETIV